MAAICATIMGAEMKVLLRLTAVAAVAILSYIAYRVAQEVAFDRFLLSTVPAAFLVAVLLIYFVPRYLIPQSSSSKREEIVSVIQARNELRKTAAQLLVGVSFVLTFLLSIYNFNRDLTQRAKQSTADQFAKAIAQADHPRASSAVGAFYLLSQIARDDPTYHLPVFNTIAEYLVRVAQDECVEAKDGKRRYKDQTTEFELSSHVQLIARAFADRDVNNDNPWRTFNLTGACLGRVNWLDAGGGVHLWMPGARLLRADMRNAILREAELTNVVAGVNLLDGFPDLKIETSQQLGRRRETDRTIYRANFDGADLSSTHAYLADFRGASFVRANLKNGVWNGAQLQIADWTGANLEGIDLTDAQLAERT
jgi:uncharacterized protein YjbI with pentapeptide repeats